MLPRHEYFLKGPQVILMCSQGQGSLSYMQLWPHVLCVVWARTFPWDLMLTQKKIHCYLCKKDVQMIVPQVKTCYVIAALAVGTTVLLVLLCSKNMHTPSLFWHGCLSCNCQGGGKKSVKKTSFIAGIRMVVHSLSLRVSEFSCFHYLNSSIEEIFSVETLGQINKWKENYLSVCFLFNEE